MDIYYRFLVLPRSRLSCTSRIPHLSSQNGILLLFLLKLVLHSLNIASSATSILPKWDGEVGLPQLPYTLQLWIASIHFVLPFSFRKLHKVYLYSQYRGKHFLIAYRQLLFPCQLLCITTQLLQNVYRSQIRHLSQGALRGRAEDAPQRRRRRIRQPGSRKREHRILTSSARICHR